MEDILTGSPAPGYEDDNGDMFLNDLMGGSEISDLELSSQLLHRGRSYPTPPSSRPSSGKPTYQPLQPSRSYKPRQPHAPVSPPRAHTAYERNAAPPANQHARMHIRKQDSFTSEASWESDADFVDRRHVPREHRETQHDLAERINKLTKTINENAAFCLEVSGKMVELARENKHLLDGTKSTLETYVLQPALRIPGLLRTYYPGVQENLQDGLEILRDYEAQLRRTVRNYANGQDMARAQGVAGIGGGPGGGSGRREVTRLKDRLVEQDALLRQSSQYVQTLMRERDALKKQLHRRSHSHDEHAAYPRLDTDDGIGGEPPQIGTQTPTTKEDEEPSSEKDLVAIEGHLQEMRALMERLALKEASNPNRRHSSSSNEKPPEDLAVDDEDGEWTML